MPMQKTEDQNKSFFIILPEELSKHIFGFLKEPDDISTLSNMASVSKKFNELSKFNPFIELYDKINKKDYNGDYFDVMFLVKNLRHELYDKYEITIEKYYYDIYLHPDNFIFMQANYWFDKNIKNNIFKLTDNQMYFWLQLERDYFFDYGPENTSQNVKDSHHKTVKTHITDFINKHRKNYPNLKNINIFFMGKNLPSYSVGLYKLDTLKHLLVYNNYKYFHFYLTELLKRKDKNGLSSEELKNFLQIILAWTPLRIENKVDYINTIIDEYNGELDDFFAFLINNKRLEYYDKNKKFLLHEKFIKNTKNYANGDQARRYAKQMLDKIFSHYRNRRKKFEKLESIFADIFTNIPDILDDFANERPNFKGKIGYFLSYKNHNEKACNFFQEFFSSEAFKESYDLTLNMYESLAKFETCNIFNDEKKDKESYVDMLDLLIAGYNTSSIFGAKELAQEIFGYIAKLLPYVDRGLTNWFYSHFNSYDREDFKISMNTDQNYIDAYRIERQKILLKLQDINNGIEQMGFDDITKSLWQEAYRNLYLPNE